MELAVRLEEDMGRRPDFIVDAAARRIFRYLKDKRVGDQLGHVLVEDVLRLFDESSVVRNDEYVSRQLNQELKYEIISRHFYQMSLSIFLWYRPWARAVIVTQPTPKEIEPP